MIEGPSLKHSNEPTASEVKDGWDELVEQTTNDFIIFTNTNSIDVDTGKDLIDDLSSTLKATYIDNEDHHPF